MKFKKEAEKREKKYPTQPCSGSMCDLTPNNQEKLIFPFGFWILMHKRLFVHDAQLKINFIRIYRVIVNVAQIGYDLFT